MPELQDFNYTHLRDAEIALAVGGSPRAIAAFRDLQRASFQNGPDAVKTVSAAADQAQATGETAQASAQGAQDRADAAFELAGEKVARNLGPVFNAVSGTISRAPYTIYSAGSASAIYDPGQLQAVMDALQALSQHFGAVVTDLRNNETLTPS